MQRRERGVQERVAGGVVVAEPDAVQEQQQGFQAPPVR
jgi:hypothetical protein